jgi:hypothetical protein
VFVENFTERLLTYALGRGVEECDRPVIRKIATPDDHKVVIRRACGRPVLTPSFALRAKMSACHPDRWATLKSGT